MERIELLERTKWETFSCFCVYVFKPILKPQIEKKKFNQQCFGGGSHKKATIIICLDASFTTYSASGTLDVSEPGHLKNSHYTQIFSGKVSSSVNQRSIKNCKWKLLKKNSSASERRIAVTDKKLIVAGVSHEVARWDVGSGPGFTTVS